MPTGAVHPHSWTGEGTLRLVFDSLGRTKTRRGATTSRVLDAFGVVAYTQQWWQSERCVQFSRSICGGAAKIPWVWVDRAWDETPQTVRFGNLMSQTLMPKATRPMHLGSPRLAEQHLEPS
jgi:hypothetical protein